jgi:hypothetical protein
MIVNATRNSVQIQSGVSLLPSTFLDHNISVLRTKDFQVMTGFKNSAIISFGSTLVSVYFSALTAYGLTVYKFKGSKFLYAVILAILMIPGQVTGTGAVADAVGEEGGVAHALHAAGDHDVGHANHDLVHGVLHGGHAGGAGLLDGEGGDLIGEAGLQGGVTGHVVDGGGGAGLAHDDLVHHVGGDVTALDNLLEHDGGQIGNGQGLQGAAHLADGGAACGYYVYILHIHIIFLLYMCGWWVVHLLLYHWSEKKQMHKSV